MPPVESALGSMALRRWLVGLAWGLAGASLFAWLQAWQAVAAGPPGAAAAAGAVVGLLAAWCLPPAPQRLRWDGQTWSGLGPGPGEARGRVRVMIDVDPWMLLHFRAEAGRARWLLATRRAAGADWHRLRLALFAPAAEAAR